MALFGWQSLVFLIPLGVGCLVALGAALGLAEGGAGPAGGEHVEDDGHDDGAFAAGRVPLMVRLMLFTLTFGGLGLSLGYLLGGLAGWRILGIGAVAAIGAWVSSVAVGRLFARRLPLLESETIKRAELLGASGRAVLAIGPGAGLVQVHDRRGNLHQVAARTLAGEAALPAGAAVLLVDYDEREKIVRVTKSPI
jgi:Protein of unknown function (DUF1449)